MLQLISCWLCAAWIPFFPAEPAAARIWDVRHDPSGASLRGLFVVDRDVIWTSGSAGTVLRSIDGGQTWQSLGPPDTGDLDFRDIHAFDKSHAVIVSAGTPARIYSTSDGGSSWQMVYEDRREPVFFDALSFDDRGHGVAFSDPVDGRLLLVVSGDRGNTWQESDRDRQPATLEGEAGFAASGTCLCLIDEHLFVGLGGGVEGDAERAARILNTDNRGQTWRATESPLNSGPSSGVFSLVFANRDHGVAVGGNYLKPEQANRNAAWTSDGGRHWNPPANAPGGYRSCVAVRYTDDGFQFVCVGPGGSDLSVDGGRTWQPLDDTGFHAVAFSHDGHLGVATGGDGQIGIWKEQ